MTDDRTPDDRTPDDDLVPNVSSEELIRRAKEDVYDDDPLEGYVPTTRSFDRDDIEVPMDPETREPVEPPGEGSYQTVDRSDRFDARWQPPVDTPPPLPVSTDLPPPAYPSPGTAPPAPPPGEPRQGSRRGGVLSAAILIALLAAGGMFLANRFASGSDVRDLNVGDCFHEFEGTEVARVETADCTEPHVYEVIANVELPDGPYPGESAIHQIGFDQCLPRFEPYVGLDYQSSLWYLTPLVPLRESWPGDRVVNCLVFQQDQANPGEPGTVTGSARSSGV
ncbi:MAG: septum formation family protein [Acidimicrobiia bacterium]